MFPDWKKAPSWAQFAAQDGDGLWYWYEHRPKYMEHGEYWASDFGGCARIHTEDDGSNSLQERPKN